MREIFIDDDNAVVAKVSVVSNFIKREKLLLLLELLALLLLLLVIHARTTIQKRNMVWISLQFCIDNTV